MATSYNLNNGYVPAAPFIALLEEWIEDRPNRNDAIAVALNMIWPKACEGLDYKMILSRPGRRLRSIRKQTWMRFDTADLILTKLGFFERWHTDPELNRIYNEVNIRRVDAVSPTCKRVRREKIKLAKRLHKETGRIAEVAREMGISPKTARELLAA